MIQNQIKALDIISEVKEPVKLYECSFFEDNENIPQNLQPIAFFDLYNHQTPQELSASFLWHTPKSLHVLCVMEDCFPHSDAEPRFDKTWEKGDLCELFFMPNSKNGHYYELHIAPNQATLELSIPNAEKLIAGEYPFESLFFDSNMNADAFVFANGAKQGWWAHFEVPKTLFESQLDPNVSSLFMLGRYNYKKDQNKPEISATSILPFPRFHQPQFWTQLSWGK